MLESLKNGISDHKREKNIKISSKLDIKIFSHGIAAGLENHTEKGRRKLPRLPFGEGKQITFPWHSEESFCAVSSV